MQNGRGCIGNECPVICATEVRELDFRLAAQEVVDHLLQSAPTTIASCAIDPTKPQAQIFRSTPLLGQGSSEQFAVSFRCAVNARGGNRSVVAQYFACSGGEYGN